MVYYSSFFNFNYSKFLCFSFKQHWTKVNFFTHFLNICFLSTRFAIVISSIITDIFKPVFTILFCAFHLLQPLNVSFHFLISDRLMNSFLHSMFFLYSLEIIYFIFFHHVSRNFMCTLDCFYPPVSIMSFFLLLRGPLHNSFVWQYHY